MENEALDHEDKKMMSSWECLKLESESDGAEEECCSFEDLEIGPFAEVSRQVNKSFFIKNEFEQLKNLNNLSDESNFGHTNSINEKKKVFRHTACEYETKLQTEIKLHLKSHEKCQACEYQSTSRLDLENHLLETHTTLTCNLCLYSIQGDYEALKVHILNHIQVFNKNESDEKKKRFTCTLLRNIKDNDWFKCKLCGFRSEFKKQLTSHLKVHKEKRHSCDVCGLKFVFRAKLKYHLKTHLSPDQVEMLKCDQCSFETKYKKSLSDHVLLHKNPSELNYFQCNICDFKCLKKYNLKVHLLTHKSDSEVPILKCDTCQYQTKFEARLKRHKKVRHLGLAKENGVQRRKSQGRIYNRVNRHAKLDSANLKKATEGFMCDICGLKTQYKGSLKTHSLVHKSPDEIDMFKCSYACGFETKLKGTLKVHELTHRDPSEITMHSCHLCEFKNRKKYNLKMHLLTHKSTDEVPMLKCKGCDYQTKFKAYMKAHLKKKHLITKCD